MKDYPRYVTRKVTPYDPVALARQTEELVCEGSSRKYTDFYPVGVYGGISTGYTVGCCLRCVFCWSSFSLNYPEQHGQLYTPQEVFKHLITGVRRRRISKLRISGGEPTLGQEHLLGVLELVEQTRYLFILETNGILLGADRTYVEALRGYRNLYVRVSLKAGNAEGFQWRTGAMGTCFVLPYRAIGYLMEAHVRFHVAAMTDPRLMPAEEKKAMIERLLEMGYQGQVEEERCDPYGTSLERLRKAGWEIF